MPAAVPGMWSSTCTLLDAASGGSGVMATAGSAFSATNASEMVTAAPRNRRFLMVQAPNTRVRGRETQPYPSSDDGAQDPGGERGRDLRGGLRRPLVSGCALAGRCDQLDGLVAERVLRATRRRRPFRDPLRPARHRRVDG